MSEKSVCRGKGRIGSMKRREEGKRKKKRGEKRGEEYLFMEESGRGWM